MDGLMLLVVAVLLSLSWAVRGIRLLSGLLAAVAGLGALFVIIHLTGGGGP